MSFFNETGTYGPTTYAWDFDANGTVDSTEHSPVYRLPDAGHLLGVDDRHQRPRDRLGDQDELHHRPNPGSGHLRLRCSPARLLDTRIGNGLSGQFSANVPRTFQVGGRGGVPANAVAVTGNLTVTNQSWSRLRLPWP